MKHNLLTIALLMVGAILIGAIVYTALKTNDVAKPEMTKSGVVDKKVEVPAGQKEAGVENVEKLDATKQAPGTKIGSELVSVDADWNLYTNHTLGLSMKVPKVNYQDISWIAEKNCFDKNVIVISDDASGRVYIGSKKVYSDDDKCYVFDFATFDKNLGGKGNNIIGGVVITVTAMKNDAKSLNVLLKKRHGYEGCVSNDVALQDGNVDISKYVVVSDYEKSEDEGCFLNWVIFANYSLTHQKLAICDLGQDYRFLGKNSDESVQNKMFDSFKFE